MCVKEETFVEVLQCDHAVVVEAEVNKLLHCLSIARHEDVPHELEDREDLIFFEYDESEAVLYDLCLFFYDLVYAYGKAGLDVYVSALLLLILKEVLLC